MREATDIEENKVDVISIITGYFPILSLMGLGYGIINQSVYYSFFHLNILEYTDFSELLLDTLNHLIVIIIPSMFILTLIAYRINSILDKQYKRLEKLDEDKRHEHYRLYADRYEKRQPRYYWFVLLVLLIGLIPTFIKFDLIYFLSAINLPLFLFIFIFYLDKFKSFFKTTFNEKISIKLFYFILCGITLLGIAIQGGLYKSLNVKNHSTLGTYAIIDKDTITSTNKYFYVGKTKNYLFFYNDSTKHTDIINCKDLKILSIN